MIGLHWAVCADVPKARAWAEQETHDRVIESIRQVGRRTSGVVWHYYTPSAAATVLSAALRAGAIDEVTRRQLLAKLDEYAPAVLLSAEAEYEPAQGFNA